jgi:hypothetical protein
LACALSHPASLPAAAILQRALPALVRTEQVERVADDGEDGRIGLGRNAAAGGDRIMTAKARLAHV